VFTVKNVISACYNTWCFPALLKHSFFVCHFNGILFDSLMMVSFILVHSTFWLCSALTRNVDANVWMDSFEKQTTHCETSGPLRRWQKYFPVLSNTKCSIGVFHVKILRDQGSEKRESSKMQTQIHKNKQRIIHKMVGNKPWQGFPKKIITYKTWFRSF